MKRGSTDPSDPLHSWRSLVCDQLIANVLNLAAGDVALLCWSEEADEFFLPLRQRLEDHRVSTVGQRWTAQGLQRAAKTRSAAELARLWAPELVGAHPAARDRGCAGWRVSGGQVVPARAVISLLPPLHRDARPAASTPADLWHLAERTGFGHLDAASDRRSDIVLVDWPRGPRALAGARWSQEDRARATWRALDVDLAGLRARNARLRATLLAADTLRLTCPRGSDLRLHKRGRPVLVEDLLRGVGTDPIPLPGGEVYVPVEERNTDGRVRVDVAGIGVWLELSGGVIQSMAPDAEPPTRVQTGDPRLARLRQCVQDRMPLGELGMGTNDAVPPVSLGSWVEKAWKCAHLGFGANQRFGGQLSGDVHADYLVPEATVWAADSPIAWS